MLTYGLALVFEAHHQGIIALLTSSVNGMSGVRIAWRMAHCKKTSVNPASERSYPPSQEPTLPVDTVVLIENFRCCIIVQVLLILLM